MNQNSMMFSLWQLIHSLCFFVRVSIHSFHSFLLTASDCSRCYDVVWNKAGIVSALMKFTFYK